MAYYDRYQKFRKDGVIDIVPFVRISENDTDLYIVYDKSRMRMDTLSYKYYGDPDYGWLILQANPQLTTMEYFISDGIRIRIPYPLSTALSRYEQAIDEYNAENN